MDEKVMKKVNDFLQQPSQKQKIIVVYGPTACGKTSLSLEIAKEAGGEIISCDSRQIYKFLDIATGKILPDEMQNIPHFMIDFLDPKEGFSVGEFQAQAQKYMGEIFVRGKIPMLVGGTGLYIDSLIYDFDIPRIPADEQIRQKYEKMAQDFGKEKVYEELQKIDSEYAKELHPNNLNYVIRAIEVKLVSGKSKRDFRIEKTLHYDTLFLNPYNGDREKLYETINKRVQKMFDDGLVDEVKDLLQNGYSADDVGLKTIGYKEALEYLEGKISLQEAIQKVQQENRNYAKRQITYFKRYEE